VFCFSQAQADAGEKTLAKAKKAAPKAADASKAGEEAKESSVSRQLPSRVAKQVLVQATDDEGELLFEEDGTTPVMEVSGRVGYDKMDAHSHAAKSITETQEEIAAKLAAREAGRTALKDARVSQT